MPLPGETVTGDDVVVAQGGKGANQAVAAARLGTDVRFVAALGDDADGAGYARSLSDAGIDCGIHWVEGRSTGAAAIWVDDRGENSIVVSPGANGVLSADDVERLATSAPIVLAQLEVPLDAVAAGLRFGVNHRVLNPAPMVGGVNELLAEVSVLVPNQTELATLAGSSNPPETVEETVDLVRSCLDGLDVVVTMGSQGAVYVSGPTVGYVPAPEVEVVDTTGAGDAFCGGLVAALARGAALEAAVRSAVASGAAAVGGLGAQSALPDLAAAQRIERLIPS